MQYWINHNGVQFGPVDLEGLKEMALTSEAYVWHEGLGDWKKITQLPELQGCYVMAGEPVAAQEPVAEGNPLEEEAAVEGEPIVDNIPPIPDVEPAVTGQPYQEQPQQPGYGYPQPQYAEQQPQQDEVPPCPPTNLVWAIIATVLCCMPAGIVGIVYALKVTSRYRMGDIKGAERASETGAWWCIASIILGIIVPPLMMLFGTGGSMAAM